jgi:hypothetical protein
VLRNTMAVRDVVKAASHTLAAAYPARTADAVASLIGDAPWPGPVVVWANVDGGQARILDAPPRGIAVGR